MSLPLRLVLLCACLCVILATEVAAQAQTPIMIVEAGDTDGLIAAIETGNANGPLIETRIRIEGSTPFQFTAPLAESGKALPDVSGFISIGPRALGAALLVLQGNGEFALARCVLEGRLRLVGAFVSDFHNTGDGGALALDQGCRAEISNSTFMSNSSNGNGGAISGSGGTLTRVFSSRFVGNTAVNGGGINLSGSSSARVEQSVFFANDATDEGCHFSQDSNRGINFPEFATFIGGSLFSDEFECGVPYVFSSDGVANLASNTFITGQGNDTFVDGSAGELNVYGSIFDSEAFELESGSRSERQPLAPSEPEDSCDDSAASIFNSLGYNISSDDTCPLDAATDLVNTNPMLGNNGDGYPVPEPGSPALDGGLSDVLVLPGQELAVLPCGYVDLSGTARPQDGNNDGVYSCDIGAMEAIGPGMVLPGHSGAFYNPSRDGEGTYVEILNDTTAVIYTFSYRPDGSGPAWFIGVAEIRGNSLVVEELLRPVGTSFGSGFDPTDIEFTPVGSMNMVFPNCILAAPGGSVAYTGDAEEGFGRAGFEAVLTQAVRLSSIVGTGCGAGDPSPNAGLSGSYFDPNRDGEGIIVEWLKNGSVLVVFFTFDENDNQLWLLGIGEPDGMTVTMDALYAASVTTWGRDFDADEVSIETWGTFTLTWTACGTLVFEYTASVGTYGSATRNYSRLSTLADTSCPDF